MAGVLLAVAALALAVRAVAAAGSAALYASPTPRTAARLEAAATAAAAAAAGTTALALLAWTGGMGLVAVPVIALAPAAVLVADLLPRSLAQERRQVLPAGVRAAARRALAALGGPLGLLEALAARLAGGAGDHAIPTVGQVLSDLVHRERAGEEALSSAHVIRRIVEFGETRVREIMVPLIHIYAVRDDARVAEAVNLVVREKVSRVPVFQQRMYNIVGIVHAFDLLGEVGPDEPVTGIMRPPLYAPENRLAHQQLRLMQRLGVNMAVVVDEHGGAVGIVTVEDLLEEVVGEIEDEYDQGETLYEGLPGGEVRVQGSMEVTRLNELFPWRLPPGDYETIAGLVVTHLGRIPRAGARLRLPDLVIEVTRADARAVREVIVRPVAAE
jgi:putative hemolysin